MLRLAKYVQANKFGKKALFGVGKNQIKFTNMKDWSILVALAYIWLKPNLKEDVFNKVSSKYKFSEDEMEIAYDILIKNNFLIEETIYFDKKDRYSRSYLYYSLSGGNPIEIQHKLKNSTVAVIGCGGIGNNISYMLASSGVGKIILVDDDKIELTNLTRQFLFCEDDIGKYKIDIIERELKKRNSEVSIIKYPLNISRTEDFYKIKEDIDLFILSADSPYSITFWMNKHSIKTKIPFLNIGYINDISVFGPFVIPSKTACFECTQVAPSEYDIKNSYFVEECNKINENFKTATFPAVNNTAASMAMNDIIRYLGDFGELMSKNRRVGIHSLKSQMEFQEMPKNTECKICGHL